MYAKFIGSPIPSNQEFTDKVILFIDDLFASTECNCCEGKIIKVPIGLFTFTGRYMPVRPLLVSSTSGNE